ncbi:branched-chain amino acid ABC transporter permease [Alsobacter sp. SYSU M60028]|uniref:Branched-chain amino acid ABC transporter permease n=1 Tax=Alsobacter ponti TaxID=2962936 RepID=A0ABT1LCK4_9HYPH|nr:branched-chain amino acid ABC transporter permease [Alsobacter ponti]MCP8938633.1 branched-chain amino acid ABC transporter permease [Alsobacter ponti]
MDRSALQRGALGVDLRPGRALWLVAPVVLAALPFVADALGDASITTLATRIVILCIAAASLNLALGYGGMVSFGHAAFLGVGGYTVGMLYSHFVAGAPFLGFVPGTDQMLLTLPAAMIASGLAAAAIGALSLRTGGVQFIMITLAFAQMLFFLFVSLKAYGGDDGMIVRRRNALPFLDTRNDTTFYFVCLVLAAAWLGLLSRIVGSRFGLVLGGIRQSERRMAALGVPIYRYKLAAFVISGMGTGLAGALLGNFSRFVSPDMMHWTQSGELMIMVILGGVGTLMGPVLGAAALIGLETVLAGWTEHWQVVMGPLLVLIVLYLPRGLGSLVSRKAGGRHG